MLKPLQWAIVILGLVLLGGAVLMWSPVPPWTPVLSEAPRGGDFSLQTATGPFHLHALRGKVVLVYFGYTYCPDICPTNLMVMAQALKALGEEESTRVRGLFVSVDPERDSLDYLATYVAHFHPAIIGATGSHEALARIAAQYGAAYRKVGTAGQAGYTVDHSSNTYVIAPDGSLHAALPHAAPASQILEVIRGLLDQSGASPTAKE